jgi:hypothetical protein
MTFKPFWAARTAVLVPLHPAPMTTTSHVFVSATDTEAAVLPGSAEAMSTLSFCAHELALPLVAEAEVVLVALLCGAHPAKLKAANAPAAADPVRKLRLDRFSFPMVFLLLLANENRLRLNDAGYLFPWTVPL